MNIYDLISETERMAKEAISTMKEVSPTELGLDIRAGYRLYVSDNCIAATKANNRSLAYYGGFEYVDAAYRIELGDYVLYSDEDDRVRSHLNRYKGIPEVVDPEYDDE